MDRDASVQEIARRCFAAIGRPELIEGPRFATAKDRVTHIEEVDDIVAGWVSDRTRDEALSRLLDGGVAAAPVMHVRDLFDDPHVAGPDSDARRGPPQKYCASGSTSPISLSRSSVPPTSSSEHPQRCGGTIP